MRAGWPAGLVKVESLVHQSDGTADSLQTLVGSSYVQDATDPPAFRRVLETQAAAGKFTVLHFRDFARKRNAASNWKMVVSAGTLLRLRGVFKGEGLRLEELRFLY